MATVVGRSVGERTIGTTRYWVIEIVDGQQRLTTLIILLKAIAKCCDIQDSSEKQAAAELNNLLVRKSDGKEHHILELNHQSGLDLLPEYLRSGAIPDADVIGTLSDSNLRKAMREAEDFVNVWKQSASLLELVKRVKYSLVFLFYELENEKAVYTVFEGLNSRGLPVDPLDKCKSMIMGIAFDLSGRTDSPALARVHQTWGDIYEVLGIREVSGSEVLRFAASLRGAQPSRTRSVDDSLEFFREECRKGLNDLQDNIDWILTVTKELKRLVSDRRLSGVTTIAHARLLAIAIRLNGHLSNKEDLLNQWERVTFRIFGMYDKDARTKTGEYIRLAWLFLNDNTLTAAQAMDKLRDLGSDYPIGDAVAQLADSNRYEGWQRSLRYFLYRYEESLNAPMDQSLWTEIWENSANDSIEHIMPVEGGTIPCWQGSLSQGIRFDRTVHRLGNLVLLPPGLNSQCSNRCFDEKSSLYRKPENLQLKMMEEIIYQDSSQQQVRNRWDLDSIKERETRLLRFAKIEWADL